MASGDQMRLRSAQAEVKRWRLATAARTLKKRPASEIEEAKQKLRRAEEFLRDAQGRM